MTTKKIPFNYDINRMLAVDLIAIIHIDDYDTRFLELTMFDDGTPFSVDGCTVTSRFVTISGSYLLSDNVPCEATGNTITIPIDAAAVQMMACDIKIEVNIVDGEKILTLPFPLWVRVRGSILETAHVTPESQGTIPELLKEAAEELERVQGFITSDDVYNILDHTLQGARNIVPTLYVEPKGNNYALVYEDSEDVKHELFDFSNLPSGGTSDYTELENKPSINNVTLQGNKTSDDLGLQDKLTAGENVTIDENGVISAEGGTDDYNALKNKPTINGDAISGYIQTSYPYLRYEKIGDRRHYLYIDREKVFQQNPSFSFIHSDYSSSFCGLNPQNRRYPEEYPTDDNGILFGITNSYNDDSYKKTFVEPNYFFFSSTENAIYLRTDHYTYPDDVFVKGEWRKIGGGSQIVSGVVNANGTITFTDSDGNTFTTSGAKLVTSGSEQISMGYDSGGFYFLFDDGQEAS